MSARFWLIAVVAVIAVMAASTPRSGMAGDLGSGFANYVDGCKPLAGGDDAVRTVFAARSVLGYSLSPDQGMLAVCTGQVALSAVTVLSVRTGEPLAEVFPEKKSSVTILPRCLNWAPDSRLLFVQMVYADLQYGEWVPFDIREGKPTAAGRHQLAEMLKYDKDQRPDFMYAKGRLQPQPPRWRLTADLENERGTGLVQRLSTEWCAPSRTGTPRMTFYADRTNYFTVLVGDVPTRHDEGLQTYDLFITENGEMVEKMRTPVPFSLERKVLCYRGASLVLFGGLGMTSPVGRWKVDFGPRVGVERAYSLDAGRAILVLRQGNECRFVSVDQW